MLGLESAGRSPLDLSRNGHTPVDYLRKRAGSISSTGDIERTILALQGAGVSSRNFAGQNLVKRAARRRRDDGSFDGQVNLTAFGSSRCAPPARAARPWARAAKWLRGAQNDDGGWGFQPGAASDPDSTGAALQALAAAGAAGSLGRRRLPARDSGRRRGLGAARAELEQLAVDRLGDPGPRRGGHRSRRGQDRAATTARLPRRAPAGRRPLPLLEVERPDAGLGHRTGDARGRAQVVPDRRGGAERRQRIGRRDRIGLVQRRPEPAAVAAAESAGRYHAAAPELGVEPVRHRSLPGGLPESELPHGATPAVPGDEIPQPRGGVKGETGTPPPVTAQPASSARRRHRGGSDASLLRHRRRRARRRHGLAYDRGPVFGARPQSPPRTSG